MMRSVATTVAFAGLLTLAGRAIGRRAALTTALGWVAAAMSGVLLLHAWLSLLDILHWRWSVLLILLPLVLLAGWHLLSKGNKSPRLPALEWADAVACGIVVVFALLASSRWIGFSDFMFHWGVKAQRFALAGHVDYAYLGRPENWLIVPHYPNGYTELLTATALLSGDWNEAGLFLWSAVFLALLVVCAREAMFMGGVAPRRRQLLTIALSAALAAFGAGNLMAGAADWPLVLAIAAALPGFLVDPTPTSDLYLGICAGFSACLKVEGVFFAAWLLVAQLWRHAARRRAPSFRGALALLGPATLVVGHWWARVAQYSLSNPIYHGFPSAERARIALATLAGPPLNHAWHGLAWLLWLLPLLLFAPRLRTFAGVLLLQVGLYSWAYAGQPADTHLLVLSSAERLQLHLLPATIAAAAVAWLSSRSSATGTRPAETGPLNTALGSPPAARRSRGAVRSVTTR